MYLIIRSAYVSLVVQLIIGFLGLHGIFIELQQKDHILYHIMIMETIVQFIELTFYIWIVIHLSKISYDVTFVRYFDWFITTPIMLFSSVFFMEYLNFKEYKTIDVNSILSEKPNELFQIFISNFLMLLFGFLTEIKKIPRNVGFIFGTLAFFYSFYVIYYNFVGSNMINQYLFFFILIIWFLYGVAFLFSYVTKNTIYNILDIVSKNFYGLFIYYNILQTANYV